MNTVAEAWGLYRPDGEFMGAFSCRDDFAAWGEAYKLHANVHDGDSPFVYQWQDAQIAQGYTMQRVQIRPLSQPATTGEAGHASDLPPCAYGGCTRGFIGLADNCECLGQLEGETGGGE